MRKLVLPAVVLVLLVGLVVVTMIRKDNAETKVADATPTATASATTNPLAASVLADYDATAVSSYAAQGSPVLYFTSDSCADCATALADINANAASIPAGVKVFKVDEDTNAALVAKYGVTAPGTWVQLDSVGSVVRTWQGGGVSQLTTEMMVSAE